MKEFTIAFVGNPNVGKSAWINALSGSDFKVGNWPGVTIERKEAIITIDEVRYHLIDLPGTYSLDDTTNEEKITSTFLHKEHIDLIVNVVDATNLQRNLYLTLLLRELQIPMVLLLNFMDEVQRFGIHIDISKLSRRLQIDVIAASAFDSERYDEVRVAIKQNTAKNIYYDPLLTNEDEEIFVALYNYLEQHIPAYVDIDKHEISRYLIKYIHNDEETIRQFEHWHIDINTLQTLKKDLDETTWEQNRYHVVETLMHYVKKDDQKRLALTRTIDKYLLHSFWGLPLFFLIFTLMLLIVFNGSAPLNDFIDFAINDVISKYASLLLGFAPDAIRELIVNGIIAGVGGVLVFIPLMALLYFMLAILEESGYMSRIAFLLDKAMRVFHLSGKSFVSLLIGFGCNVPAIYSTRTLDNEKQKKLTALLVPFMSCGARLPVYVLFASAFFGRKAPLMILSIYGIGILLALIMALIFQHFSDFKSDELFVLELPPYRIPSLSVVFHKVKMEVQSYIKKAVHVVMWAMIIIWGLSYFPTQDTQTSYVSKLAKAASPIYEPLGFGNRWECVASLPGSIVAKETVVGFLDQVLLDKPEETQTYDLKKDLGELGYRLGDSLKHSVTNILSFGSYEKQSDTLVHAISSLWNDERSALRAFCFMVYILLSIPCIMTLNAIYREYGRRLLCISLASMIIVPYIVTFLIFQIFSLIYLL